MWRFGREGLHNCTLVRTPAMANAKLADERSSFDQARHLVSLLISSREERNTSMATKKTPKEKPQDTRGERKNIIDIFKSIEKTETELQLELRRLKEHLEMNRFYRSV
jgi:hypothetical protein